MRPPGTVWRLIRSGERPATRWPGRGGGSWRPRWGRRPLSWASNWAQVARRCPGPTISLWSVTCVRAVSTSRSASASARASGRDLHGLGTSVGQAPGPRWPHSPILWPAAGDQVQRTQQTKPASKGDVRLLITSRPSAGRYLKASGRRIDPVQDQADLHQVHDSRPARIRHRPAGRCHTSDTSSRSSVHELAEPHPRTRLERCLLPPRLRHQTIAGPRPAFQVSGRSLSDALERSMITSREVVMVAISPWGARVDE